MLLAVDKKTTDFKPNVLNRRLSLPNCVPRLGISLCHWLGELTSGLIGLSMSGQYMNTAERICFVGFILVTDISGIDF